MIGLAFIIKAGFFVAGVVQAAMAVTEIKTAKVMEKNEIPQIDDSDIKSEEVKKQVEYFNEVSKEYTNGNIGLCKIKAMFSAIGALTSFAEVYICKYLATLPIPFAIMAGAIVCLSIINYKQEVKNYKEVVKAYEKTSDEAFDEDDDDEVFDDYQEV